MDILEVLREIAVEIDGLRCTAGSYCCVEELENARNIVLIKIEKIKKGDK